MAGRIVIDTERCKGCGLCVIVCPKECIAISTESNRNGYFPAQAKGAACTGCAQCAIICPEGIIEVAWDQPGRIRIIETDSKKHAAQPVEEKA